MDDLKKKSLELTVCGPHSKYEKTSEKGNRNMISNNSEYREYIEADLKALNRTNTKFPKTLFDYPLRFERYLRKAEYYTNCKKTVIFKSLVLFFKARYLLFGNKCGFTIPLNTCGNGVAIGANVVVNKDFDSPNITIAGVPEKKISDKGSHGLLYC